MNIIHQYIYNKKDKDSKNRRIIGVLTTSHTTKDTIGVGWSLCNKVDDFDRDRGMSIAKGRAHKMSTEVIPDSIIDDYRKFVNRCYKYYKNKNVVDAYTTR